LSERIHSTVIIDSTAQVDASVSIGAYSVIGPHCVVKAQTTIGSHVVLEGFTSLGQNCQVASGAVLGGKPQDVKFVDVPSYVTVGDGTIIREFATIHRSTHEGGQTVVGERSMLMAYAHIAHDCIIGNEVMIANNTQIAGHVTIEDGVFLGGANCIHQGVRIGRYSILGGVSSTRQDIPPFTIADGRPARIMGLNKVALKRRGFSLESRERIKQAFKLLWFSEFNYPQAIEQIRATMVMDANIELLIHFVETSKRGIHNPKSTKNREHLMPDVALPL
jgi:UDP-N-acetylglucosamine acyltransferase